MYKNECKLGHYSLCVCRTALPLRIQKGGLIQVDQAGCAAAELVVDMLSSETSAADGTSLLVLSSCSASDRQLLEAPPLIQDEEAELLLNRDDIILVVCNTIYSIYCDTTYSTCCIDAPKSFKLVLLWQFCHCRNTVKLIMSRIGRIPEELMFIHEYHKFILYEY
jgi:hypothetical protein